MKKLTLAATAIIGAAQPALAQDASNFDGIYAGVQVAGARVHDTYNDSQEWYFDDITVRKEKTGAIAGLHAGYNSVHGALLVGVEAELNFGVIDTFAETTPNDPSYEIGSRTSMLGSARVKLGVTDGKFAAHVNGGFAFSNTKHNYLESDGSGEYFNDNGDRSGWVLGFGVDYAISPRSSLGLAFSHYQFGTTDHLLLEPTAVLADCSGWTTAAPDGLCHFPMRNKFETVAVKYSYRF